MYKRQHLGRSRSRKMFSRGARRVHRKNGMSSSPAMRGGIRL